MNLSKTAKRFLSSTMAIALAGGSVLAFGNSASADPDQADTVRFTGDVALECALITNLTTPATYTPSYNSANNSDTAGEDRTTGLSVTTTVDYDCNSDTVDIQVTDATSGYTPPTNASELKAKHSWEWGKGDSASTAFIPDSGKATLNGTETTDANGDVQVSIESIWTTEKEGAEELFAGTYTASLTLTVTAQ